MDNRSDYNKLFNLNHKSDYYLTNNYEDNFINNEWNNEYDIMNLDYSTNLNDDIHYIDNEYNRGKRYSFSEKKSYKFK